MRITRKMWIGAGVVATAVIAGAPDIRHDQIAFVAEARAADPAPAANDFGNTTFAKALEKMLAGEGGEGGIAWSQFGPTFGTPALNDAQLKQGLVGRTVRKDQAVAFHLGTDGNAEGWKLDWSKADAAKCPDKLGEYHEIQHGQCYTAARFEIKGKYEIKNGQVCLPSLTGKPADGQACYYVGFALNKVIVGDGKKLFGSGKDLVDGKSLAIFRNGVPKS